MNNSIKYNFDDFTENHYRSLIRLTKKTHTFISYNEAKASKDNYVIWRHDVDFSPHRALALAKIEKEEAVKATYFIQLTSEFYNVFEKPIKEIFKKIISLGHHIGVHFYPLAYNVTNQEMLEKYLTIEKETLENLLDINISVFSYHNPVPEILAFDNHSYANLINTYATFFKENLKYCSDSNGYWRFNRMEDFIKSNTSDKLHILTHPEWWQVHSMSPTDRVWRCINGRSEKLKKEYVELLTSMGREVVR